MPLEPRLENYLSSLDRALSAIPVSDRADIVMELKSHVLTAMDREPKPALDTVLAALGEPEIVANRYLMERGLKPGKPPIAPIVKWLVIGFLGTLAFFVVLIALFLSAMGPVVKISEKEERMQLFGGLVDIDGKNERIKIGSSVIEGTKTDHFEGKVSAGAGDSISFTFDNGRISATASDGNDFAWDCAGKLEDAKPPVAADRANERSLDVSSIANLKCAVRFPKGSKVKLEGRNGRLEIDEPLFDLSASLNNGKVAVVPEKDTKYAFDFKVRNGKAETPESAPDAKYHLKVQVGNGKISIDEKEKD